MKKLPSQAGFTLIELLVIITIVGIFSAVALAALQDARDKARDSAIKQQVRAIAQTFELHQAKTGSYNLQYGWFRDPPGTFHNCTTEPNFAPTASRPYADKLRDLCYAIENRVINTTSNYMFFGVSAGFQPQRSYSIMVRLNNGNWYCQGNSGKTYEGPPNPGGGSWTGSGCSANP